MFSHRRENGRILFGDASLELAFDSGNGRWLTLRDLQSGDDLLQHGSQQAPVTISVNGVSTATMGREEWWSVVDAETVGTQAVCTGSECTETDRGPMLTVHTKDGDWLIDQRYTLPTGEDRIERGLRLEYQGDGEALLRSAELRIPLVHLGPVGECFVEAPGYPTKAHQALGSLPLGVPWKDIISGGDDDGAWAPTWCPGLVGLHNPGRSLAVAAWAYSETEPSVLSVRRCDQGTQVVHSVMLCDRFRRGHALEWEGQYVRVAHRPWIEALEDFQRWYDQAGLHAVADRPAWAQAPHIYELFIGDQLVRQSKFHDLDALIDDLPRIRDLGFDVLEIMPHMPFPSYSVFDYYDVDTHYGSAEGLRRLTARAHELGMRVLIDVVFHGVLDREAVRAMEASSGRTGWMDVESLPERHRYRVEHPEWFMRTEFGTPAATYTWAFDHANPGWQDFMVGVFTHYVREYDVDGFRVDALIWNIFPNWAEGLPYRPSGSVCASERLLQRVRQETHKIKPDVVLYTETTGPLFTRTCDLAYNYDMQWLYSGLAQPISPRGFAYVFARPLTKIRAADIGPWLEQRHLAKPAGARTVHHLDSHDTHEWGGLCQYRREAFGEDVARLFFAFCCSLDGGMMVFSGAEEGVEEYYRTLLRLRRELPALSVGSCDYTAVHVDSENVYAPLRIHGRQIVVPVLHFADRSVRVCIALPVEKLPLDAQSYRLVDRLSGAPVRGPGGEVWTRAQLGAVRMELGPYQARMLEIVPLEGG
jgi:glycosidase